MKTIITFLGVLLLISHTSRAMEYDELLVALNHTHHIYSSYYSISTAVRHEGLQINQDIIENATAIPGKVLVCNSREYDKIYSERISLYSNDEKPIKNIFVFDGIKTKTYCDDNNSGVIKNGPLSQLIMPDTVDRFTTFLDTTTIFNILQYAKNLGMQSDVHIEEMDSQRVKVVIPKIENYFPATFEVVLRTDRSFLFEEVKRDNGNLIVYYNITEYVKNDEGIWFPSHCDISMNTGDEIHCDVLHFSTQENKRTNLFTMNYSPGTNLVDYANPNNINGNNHSYVVGNIKHITNELIEKTAFDRVGYTKMDVIQLFDIISY